MSAAVRGTRLPWLRDCGPIAAAIHAFIISGVAFQLVPLLIGAVRQDLHLSAAQVGAIPACELGGVTVANFVGAWLIRSMSWRVLLMLGWVLWIAGNVVSVSSTGVTMLLALRAVAGIGGGLLSAVSTAGLARAASPERAFAASAVAQALLAAACTLVAPALLAAGSWGALYLLMAALGVPGLLAGRSIAALAGRRAVAASKARRERSPLSVQLMLGPAGVLLSYVAMSMVWTYYGQIGESSHLSTSAVASALSLGAISGLLASLSVTAVGSKVPRGLALLTSLALTCGALSFAFTSSGAWMFSASVVVWTLGTGIFTPYAFAATAAADATGSSTALASALSGAGIALGPLVAAPFIAAEGLGSVRWLASVFLVAGFLALAMLLRRIRGRVAAMA